MSASFSLFFFFFHFTSLPHSPPAPPPRSFRERRDAAPGAWRVSQRSSHRSSRGVRGAASLRLGHINLGILVSAGLEGHPVIGGVGEGNLALEGGTGGENHLALDRELAAPLEARHLAPLEQPVEPRHLLVHLGVEVDGGGDALALGGEDQPEVVGDHVGVAADAEEVSACLDGGEALSAHHDGPRVVEGLDGGTHGGLELEHLGRGGVGGVDRLVVLDHGEGHDAVVALEHLLELVEPDPEVVGVEEGVPRDVLEGLLVALGALRRLAEQHVLVAGADGEVAALLVRLGPLRHLHDKRLVGLGKEREQVEVEGGTQVVRVGHKHVLDASVEELLQHPGPGEGGVQVAVPGGAPLLDGGGGVLCGLQGRLVDLGHLVLHHLPVARRQLTVVLEGRLGVGTCGEGVHKHALDVARRLAEAHHLLGDKVEEGVVSLDLEQGLCLLEPHAGAEAPVELEHHRLLEEALDLALVHRLEIPLVGEAGGRLDGALEDHAILAGNEGLVSLEEGLDGALGEALALHQRRDLLDDGGVGGAALEAHALLSSRSHTLFQSGDVGRAKERSDLTDGLTATVAERGAGGGREGRAGAHGHAQRQDRGIVEVWHPLTSI
mmetsp:Transcript_24068/g.60935  ORF Transcript_24068/g.60935 Transcript_24068/m.60935 type:complete len:607 (-) Transcript_24068:17-1837(-)